jgi:hypothetical protein
MVVVVLVDPARLTWVPVSDEAGAVPPQLAGFDQFPSDPPPVQV